MLKEIPGYEGYAVTDCGRVWSYKRGEWKSTRINNAGYITVGFTVDGKAKTCIVHRLVMLTFVGIDPNKEQVDHIDGNKLNNNLSNLRWTTHAENMHNLKLAKGYCWNKKAEKWRAVINVNKKQIHIGYYNTETEARQAYLDAKKIHHLSAPINKMNINEE